MARHDFLCTCKKCMVKLNPFSSTDARVFRAGREARQRRTNEAPYTEVGGGETCDACGGSGTCQRCDGTSWFKLRNGTSVRCKACEPRGPKASEADRGKCWPCHGRGKKRPTRHRRD